MILLSALSALLEAQLTLLEGFPERDRLLKGRGQRQALGTGALFNRA